VGVSLSWGCAVVASFSVSASGVPVLSGPFVGFEGSRHLPPSWGARVAAAVSAVRAAGLGVASGCAAGADALVRSAAPGSVAVFSVASGAWGSGRGAFAARSSALVRAVAASGSGAFFVGLVLSGCPAGLLPSPSSSRCFRGLGSGSWASLALAAGLGLPVVVFAALGVSLPAWGSWVPASSVPWLPGPASAWAGAFALLPAAPESAPAQLSLF